MKFNINLKDEKIAQLIEKDVDIDFIDGFLKRTKFLSDPKIDYDVDDMICYSLIEKQGDTYLIIPDGDCLAEIYQLFDSDIIKSVKDTLENFEEQDL